MPEFLPLSSCRFPNPSRHTWIDERSQHRPSTLTTFSSNMEKALLPLTVTSDPRPFNQQLPEPPDLRCVLKPQDNPELAPALVCALCCCFGIIYCCFGEGRAKVGGEQLPKTVILKDDANLILCFWAISPPLSRDTYLQRGSCCPCQLLILPRFLSFPLCLCGPGI